MLSVFKIVKFPFCKAKRTKHAGGGGSSTADICGKFLIGAHNSNDYTEIAKRRMYLEGQTNGCKWNRDSVIVQFHHILLLLRAKIISFKYLPDPDEQIKDTNTRKRHLSHDIAI